MTPLGTAILLIVLLVIAFGARNRALIGFMAGVMYLTQGQQFVLFGFNIWALRLIEIAAFTRIMAKREFSFSNLNKIDRLFLFFQAFVTIVFCLRSPEGQTNQIGMAVDAFLCYFSFRGFVRDVSELESFLSSFLKLLGPYVILLLIETFAHFNIFASMHGIDYGNWDRGGRLRDQGSFRHPSLLGTLGASFLPLYMGFAASPVNRRRAIIGIVLCLAIVWASNSGGPLNCVLMGVVGWCFWKLRTRMRLVRRLLVAGIIALALFMKAPIWYLPARMSALSGGTGYHRSFLIDTVISHFSLWGLAGMPVQGTAGWFPYDLSTTGGSDITNQYIEYGLAAGVLAVVLFIVLLVRAFRQLGIALAAVRADPAHSPQAEVLLWGLGTVLLVHLTNWIGITYFDQTYAIWYFHLAAIASLTDYCIGLHPDPQAPLSGAMDDDFPPEGLNPTVSTLVAS